MEIQTVVDRERGCGWRKPGGLYLRCDGVGKHCGRLPLVLTVCPTCSVGIKPTRGWTWIDAWALFSEVSCGGASGWDLAVGSQCDACPVSAENLREMGSAGLLWIGGKFYPTPEHWMNESREQGVSRRIQTVPNDFELGKTWVFVAHRKATETTCIDCDGGRRVYREGPNVQPSCGACQGTGAAPVAAIFHAFKPTSVEYIVKDDDDEAKLERLVKRGVTPVRVRRDIIEGVPVHSLPPTPTAQEQGYFDGH